MESTPSDATVVIFDAAFVIQMLVPRIKAKHLKIMLNEFSLHTLMVFLSEIM